MSLAVRGADGGAGGAAGGGGGGGGALNTRTKTESHGKLHASLVGLLDWPYAHLPNWPISLAWSRFKAMPHPHACQLLASPFH